MKTLTIYAYDREQRYYSGLTQEALDDLLDEWELDGCVIDCDDSETDWTVLL